MKARLPLLVPVALSLTAGASAAPAAHGPGAADTTVRLGTHLTATAEHVAYKGGTLNLEGRASVVTAEGRLTGGRLTGDRLVVAPSPGHKTFSFTGRRMEWHTPPTAPVSDKT